MHACVYYLCTTSVINRGISSPGLCTRAYLFEPELNRGPVKMAADLPGRIGRAQHGCWGIGPLGQ
mgnify:CR=1 FL=1